MKTKNKLVAIAMLLMLFVIVMPAMVEKASASGALGGIWHFDEGTGTTAYDSSGNGNHGTVHGAIWTDGKIGKALEFDGVNDYVNVPDSNSLDITGKITLEAWIYPYTVTTMQVIVQKYNYSGPPYNGAYYLGVGGYGYNNKILFGLSHNGYNFYYILSNTNIAANTWTHVAATSNGTHMIIYINGIKDKVATYPPGVIYASTAPLRIGCFLPELGVSRFFNGLIDEVRVSSGTIWTVDDDRVQCPNADFTSIQAAVNKASPDDTIIVHEGTYYENLIVPKSLTIQGIDKETVVLQAQPVGYGDKAIEILASDVTISGFTISGYAATETKPGSTYWGVYAYGSSSSRYSNIVITNNIFTFLGQGGIRLGYVDTSLIADNVFKRETRLVWYDPPGPTPGSYIEVTRGGAGPELWYCTNVIIDPNVIQTTGVGIFLYSSSDILIEANTISAPDTVNPSDIGIHVQSCTNIDIIGNTILNFTAGPKSGYTYGTTGAGINILASKAINVGLSNLRNNTVGVIVQRLDLTTEPREIDIHYNNLEHNTEFGVLNCYTWIGKDKTYTPTNASYIVNARYNWWGHETGPYHATSWTYMGAPYGPHYGSGDNVSDYVLYDPWLKTPFVPPLVHDVAIISIVPSATRIIVGTTIQIDVTAKNEGTAYENFTVTLSYDGTNIGTADITDLAPSKEKLLTFNWDTTGVTPNQDYTITATASTVPGETDLTDNVKTVVVRIGTPPTIKVEPPSYTAKFINETFSVNITMNDLNIGWKAVAVQVGITYNTSLVKLVSVVEGPFLKKYGDTFFLTSVERHYIYGDHVLVGIILLPNAPGQWPTFPSGSGVLATITFKVISQLRGYDRYQGYITPIPEFNFTLHLTKIMSPEWGKVPHNIESGHCEILPTNIADINYDGIVDIADIYSMALGFGESPNRPRWDPELDVNHDDIIDIEDIYIVALNYGWTQDC